MNEVVLLPEHVTLDARKLADYLLALFHQSKRFYAENVKAKATRNEIRKEKMFNTKVAFITTGNKSCKYMLHGHKFN